MKEEDLLPCPCCKNDMPFKYITYSTCVLECKCGIGIAGCKGAVKVVYDSFDEMPDELKPYANPASALIFMRDGREVHWEEHRKYGVSCMRAFEHAGLTAIWNNGRK
ncbi:hypothetical protein PS2_141 [Serratia phage PS2]|uniref:Uncharacterized protein n=1 Tax=Serratia phage PS2 TaxID=1481112 RepID=A0A023W6L2_9CAUD|nr:hypothetical protein FF83_gp274 [Serratia phage PS2]AHY25387.1 hypothetical protein PS2_141 [Serratia phage PS2]